MGMRPCRCAGDRRFVAPISRTTVRGRVPRPDCAGRGLRGILESRGMPFLLMILLRRCITALIGGLALAAGGMMTADAQDGYAAQRRQMLEDITRLTRETRFETGRAALSERVMTAMAKVPRHRFVPASEERSAYHNRPLPIGSGQTDRKSVV